jgi:hypothetical protein
MRKAKDQCEYGRCVGKATYEVLVGKGDASGFDRFVGIYCKSHADEVVKRLNRKEGS